MWIAFNIPGQGTGFMSIVAKDWFGTPSDFGDDAEISVRFRRRQDAELLFAPGDVVETFGSDYQFRVFTTRGKMQRILSKIVEIMNATNFKDAVPTDDDQMYDTLAEAWTVFGRLQEGGPYGYAGAFTYAKEADEWTAD